MRLIRNTQAKKTKALLSFEGRAFLCLVEVSNLDTFKHRLETLFLCGNSPRVKMF